jgi:hypothetical protein
MNSSDQGTEQMENLLILVFVVWMLLPTITEIIKMFDEE